MFLDKQGFIGFFFLLDPTGEFEFSKKPEFFFRIFWIKFFFNFFYQPTGKFDFCKNQKILFKILNENLIYFYFTRKHKKMENKRRWDNLPLSKRSANHCTQANTCKMHGRGFFYPIATFEKFKIIFTCFFFYFY